MPGYTDLQTYRKCPRLYGFKLLGYTPIETPEPIQTGQFVHAAIAAYFKGTDWWEVIAEVSRETEEKLHRLLDAEKATKALKELITSTKRAQELTSRYIEHWAKDYTAVLVEPELKLGNVVCHPDLIAYYQEQRAIVDYKTSKSPDMRWYDVSGQVDLYAYVLHQDIIGEDINLVIYDVISEEGIFRHTRPPRLEAGCILWNQIITLPSTATGSGNTIYIGQEVAFPHFTYDCPQRCQFWIPCWLLETADWSACEDYLKGNFIKEEKDV